MSAFNGFSIFTTRTSTILGLAIFFFHLDSSRLSLTQRPSSNMHPKVFHKCRVLQVRFVAEHGEGDLMKFGAVHRHLLQ